MTLLFPGGQSHFPLSLMGRECGRGLGDGSTWLVAREGDDFGALDRDGGLQMRHGLAVAVGQSVFDGSSREVTGFDELVVWVWL